MPLLLLLLAGAFFLTKQSGAATTSTMAQRVPIGVKPPTIGAPVGTAPHVSSGPVLTVNAQGQTLQTFSAIPVHPIFANVLAPLDMAQWGATGAPPPAPPPIHM